MKFGMANRCGREAPPSLTWTSSNFTHSFSTTYNNRPSTQNFPPSTQNFRRNYNYSYSLAHDVTTSSPFVATRHTLLGPNLRCPTDPRLSLMLPQTHRRRHTTEEELSREGAGSLLEPQECRLNG